MADHQLTQEVKQEAVIVVIKGEHNDLEIFRFLKVVKSLIYKVYTELETGHGNVSPISTLKKAFQTL